jgi:hypothetical protein
LIRLHIAGPAAEICKGISTEETGESPKKASKQKIEKQIRLLDKKQHRSKAAIESTDEAAN